jgi:hypothetical protein
MRQWPTLSPFLTRSRCPQQPDGHPRLRLPLASNHRAANRQRNPASTRAGGGQRQERLVRWPCPPARGRSNTVSLIYTFKLPLRRAGAASERPIDFLVKMSRRAHFARKLYFILGPRSAHFHMTTLFLLNCGTVSARRINPLCPVFTIGLAGRTIGADRLSDLLQCVVQFVAE